MLGMPPNSEDPSRINFSLGPFNISLGGTSMEPYFILGGLILGGSDYSYCSSCCAFAIPISIYDYYAGFAQNMDLLKTPRAAKATKQYHITSSDVPPCRFNTLFLPR